MCIDDCKVCGEMVMVNGGPSLCDKCKTVRAVKRAMREGSEFALGLRRRIAARLELAEL